MILGATLDNSIAASPSSRFQSRIGASILAKPICPRRGRGSDKGTCLTSMIWQATARHLLQILVSFQPPLNSENDHEAALRNAFVYSKPSYHAVLVNTTLKNGSTMKVLKQYIVKQFVIEDIAALGAALGWRYSSVTDHATQGKAKALGPDGTVVRKRQVVIWERK